ncbi:MAG: hypothetical protein COX01_02610 [Verrucomicrobia bacterium CG22_combo_CG10-13_8_21_14_all_43_17]|nr:MAG: hypothetical protein AUJ82_01050 [Verrucomicrobia bacterium CG1_02_43_26]PIP59484.1 MAG: hypothetical protein COX01_02610 [Verrucomicrobia bacterium CG22_combo_CG10-13_8_21_14_all_43_17]
MNVFIRKTKLKENTGGGFQKAEIREKRSDEVKIVMPQYTLLSMREVDNVSTMPETKRYDQLMEHLATEGKIFETLINHAVIMHEDWDNEKLMEHVKVGVENLKSVQEQFVHEKNSNNIVKYLNDRDRYVISSIADYSLSEVKYLLKTKHDLPNTVITKF